MEQLLRLGMDGDDLNCFADELLAACDAEASAADGGPCCGGQSKAWRPWDTPGDPETTNTGSGIKKTKYQVHQLIPDFTPSLYQSVWGWAGRCCGKICGFCGAVDLRSSPRRGTGRRGEEVSPCV